MQEKGQRKHAKHINNFSELLLTNIRRSTSYNIQSSTSINHQKLLIFIQTSIKFNDNNNGNVVLLSLQNPHTNKEKFLLPSENNMHFTAIQHFHL